MLFRLHKLGDEERQAGCYNTPEHRQTILDTARESVVLLKNKVKKLPLDQKKTKKVLVIGDNADRIHSNGGGSAEIKALYEISPLMGIKKLLGGNAEVVYTEGYLAEVLFGRVNPSGKLPESFPYNHKDCSAHSIGEFPGGETVKYTEGIFVGYRYYDTKKVPVRFPFGYGLSYTEFTYQNLKTEGTYPNVKVSVDVTNTGEVPGKEIVEIYAGKKDSAVERAVKELRGFGKVELNPGDTKTVTVEPEAFQYYNEEKAMFVTESGTYQIYAGKSVEDICCECEIEIE